MARIAFLKFTTSVLPTSRTEAAAKEMGVAGIVSALGGNSSHQH